MGSLGWFHADSGALSVGERYLLAGIAEQVQRDLYHYLEFQRTRDAALMDPLTGLYNIRYLASKHQARLPDSSVSWLAEPVSVLYMDLDNFRPVNDTFGEVCGDRVLTDVAQLLKRALRPADQIVRYGGDEFVAIMPQTTRAEAKRAARRLREAVCAYDSHLTSALGAPIVLDISIGIADSIEDGNELHTLISLADARMFQEKTTHKAALQTSHALINAERMLDPECSDTLQVRS